MCKMTNRKSGENTVNFTPQNAELLKNPLKKIFKFSAVHKKHVKYLSALTKNMHTYEGLAKDKTYHVVKTLTLNFCQSIMNTL